TRGGCRFLTLRDLRLGPAAGRVRVSTQGAARVGFRFLGFCLSPLSWEGRVETMATPVLGADWQLRLRDLDSNLCDAQGGQATVANRLWKVVKGRVEEEWRDFAFDLGPPIDEAKLLLRATATAAKARPVLAALEQMRPAGVEATNVG